ncbi:MAG: hypothetical protein QM532_03215 [Cyanobium sp. MAG06]|nr:hypothetical protein [Cyanobium sp. MAG06]
MIQRNGRINRLGSSFSNIYIYNMSPAREIEEYIRLEKRLKNKIEYIKASIGSDQSVLGEDVEYVEFIDNNVYTDTDPEFVNDLYLNESKSGEDISKEQEKKLDILSTEDEFENDLELFKEKYKGDEKYMKKIFNIPKGK